MTSHTTNFCCLFMVALMSCMLVMCSSQEWAMKVGLKLYVSPDGNDNWSGRLPEAVPDKTDGPLLTIGGARNAIRKLKGTKNLPNGNVLVELQEGTYTIQETIKFEGEDGGADSLSSIIYRGKRGSEVRLSGGKSLADWALVTDTDLLGKFRTELRGKIYQINLAALGTNDFGSPSGGGIELFFNDKPMRVSRYPNNGFLKITGFPDNKKEIKDAKEVKFNYDDQRINLWKAEKDAWVHGYWYYDWSEERQKVSDIDTGKKIIELAPPYHRYGYRVGQWFYGFNLLSEIDEPGEYYIDREKGILFFYPPSDIKKGTSYVSISKNLIDLNNVSNLVFEGLTIEGCRESAVIIRECNNTSIIDCTFKNIGDWAVIINGGRGNSVRDCDIYYTGAGGIKIEAGDIKTLTPAECVADNNYIHHIARFKRMYSPGISLNGVGNKAAHNLIAHLPHMAIYFNGNDHLIEYNEINDVCYESNDAGAVYAGRSWTMRGNIVRYNYLHDISGFESKGCVGVYLDDLFCGTEIYGNIFNRVTRAVMIGGGRDNSVTNNIFVDCIPSLHVDARGLGWYAVYLPEILKEAESNGTLLGISYNKPPYSTRFPRLTKILGDTPAAPKGNVVSLNVCSGGNWDKASGFWKMSIEDKARPYLIMEKNIVSKNSGVEDSVSTGYVIADPMFSNQKNPEQGKFKLDASSPALKFGFKQIPFEKIGLYKNRYRTNIPVDQKEVQSK